MTQIYIIVNAVVCQKNKKNRIIKKNIQKIKKTTTNTKVNATTKTNTTTKTKHKNSNKIKNKHK